MDRHLPSSFPSIEFSSAFSELIVQFQRHLALCISSYSPSLSSAKLADLFDGRLFAFTLYQLNQSSSKKCFDSDTMDIVNACLTLLKYSPNDDIFLNIVMQLVQSNHITFSTSPSNELPVLIVKRHKITRISNPFVDTYLESILSPNNTFTFDFIKPKNIQSTRYEGTVSSPKSSDI